MNQTVYNVLLGVALFVSILFIVMIYVTGKGDAMSSGGGGIRTSFKGKASIEDQIAKVTYIMGAVFMTLLIALDFIGNRIFTR
ncbi:MAG: preprotein translocase subunit SecG [Armatimonadetes bacterium]|nr:preprotein translocase subunit SecG [Armatimonadota bacterium]